MPIFVFSGWFYFDFRSLQYGRITARYSQPLISCSWNYSDGVPAHISSMGI